MFAVNQLPAASIVIGLNKYKLRVSKRSVPLDFNGCAIMFLILSRIRETVSHPKRAKRNQADI